MKCPHKIETVRVYPEHDRYGGENGCSAVVVCADCDEGECALWVPEREYDECFDPCVGKKKPKWRVPAHCSKNTEAQAIELEEVDGG